MPGGFNNPIVGGGGALAYPSIHSPGFITGVSGWRIAKDGSAEFNNLLVRGTFNGTNYVVNAAGEFFYSPSAGAGNLIASITASAGTDAYGNYYLPGETSYVPNGGGGYAAVQLAAGSVSFWTAAVMVSVANPWTGVGSIITSAPVTPNVLQLASGPNAGDYIGLASPVKVTGGWHYSGPIVGYAPGGTTDETWHSVSLTGAPAGTAGTCRVKVLPLQNMAVFDIEITFTTLAAQATFTIGSLPSASYYPQAARHCAAGLAGTATGSPQARALIPVSGGVQLVDIPSGASGFGCTAVYPLD